MDGHREFMASAHPREAAVLGYSIFRFTKPTAPADAPGLAHVGDGMPASDDAPGAGKSTTADERALRTLGWLVGAIV